MASVDFEKDVVEVGDVQNFTANFGVPADYYFTPVYIWDVDGTTEDDVEIGQTRRVGDGSHSWSKKVPHVADGHRIEIRVHNEASDAPNVYISKTSAGTFSSVKNLDPTGDQDESDQDDDRESAGDDDRSGAITPLGKRKALKNIALLAVVGFALWRLS